MLNILNKLLVPKNDCMSLADYEIIYTQLKYCVGNESIQKIVDFTVMWTDKTLLN